MSQETTEMIFSHGVHTLVGHGFITNGFCMKFARFVGCLLVALHHATLNGENYEGKIEAKPTFNSCGKPSCPKCYKWGWALREARRIHVRLKRASEKLGLPVEHLSVNFPSRYWELPLDVLRVEACKALKNRGIIGGCLIPHAFRFRRWLEAMRKNKPLGWSFEFHFHFLGFIKGGYKCRGCKKMSCSTCDGFEGRTRREWKKDGIIVKVAEDGEGNKGERVSVGYTAWYQLGHASYDNAAKSPRVVTWFGICGYRNLKVKTEIEKATCDGCGHDFEPIWYVGAKSFVTDRDSADFKSKFWADYKEHGKVAWIPAPVERKQYRRFREENPTYLGSDDYD